MRIVLASSNPHKLSEIRATFDTCGDLNIALLSLAEGGINAPEPVEDGQTFEANAILKARYYAAAAGMLCLADDSGLEVDALGGEPGVRSARYAGIEGPRDVVDPANNRLLLERLGETPAERRTARFVCAMALCEADRTLAVVRGTVEGRILLREEAGPEGKGRGQNGFGYDPLFLLPQRGQTTAELSPAEKNAVSHRGQAARLMWEQIRKLGLADRR